MKVSALIEYLTKYLKDNGDVEVVKFYCSKK